MILYLGLDPSRYPHTKPLWHYPLIQTEKIISPQIAEAREQWSEFTHVIFTSQTAVRYWFEEASFCDKTVIAVGRATAMALRERGVIARIAEEETQEGVIEMLEAVRCEAKVFWPRSKLARGLLEQYLRGREMKYVVLDLYTTVPREQEKIEDWSRIEEIVFTSPSTVDAFWGLYGAFPPGVLCKALGKITQRALEGCMRTVDEV